MPRLTPSARELDDLKVLLFGGYPPLRGFLSPVDVASVLARSQPSDGTPWRRNGRDWLATVPAVGIPLS